MCIPALPEKPSVYFPGSPGGSDGGLWRALQACLTPGEQLGSPGPMGKALLWLPDRREGCAFELPIQAQMEKASTKV